jgi:hypothetical protein
VAAGTGVVEFQAGDAVESEEPAEVGSSWVEIAAEPLLELLLHPAGEALGSVHAGQFSLEVVVGVVSLSWRAGLPPNDCECEDEGCWRVT